MLDIHVIAVNQLANPIRDWVVKTVAPKPNEGVVLGMIHRRVDDDRFEVTGDFGNAVYDDFYNARDHFAFSAEKVVLN